MASEQFPMFRLATLLARQLSSPIASRIKADTALVNVKEATPSVRKPYGGRPWRRTGKKLIKVYATTHPRMRKEVIARIGQLYRTAELRFKLWSLRLPAPAQMPALPAAEAVQVGADLIGEMIIFTLGAAIIIFEVNRQAEKQEAKVLDERSQWVALLLALDELKTELVLQQRDIDRLRGELQALAPPAP